MSESVFQNVKPVSEFPLGLFRILPHLLKLVTKKCLLGNNDFDQTTHSSAREKTILLGKHMESETFVGAITSEFHSKLLVQIPEQNRMFFTIPYCCHCKFTSSKVESTECDCVTVTTDRDAW